MDAADNHRQEHPKNTPGPSLEVWPRTRPFNEGLAGGWVGGMAFTNLNTPIAIPSQWSR